jgi:anti-anti-sigma factor
MVIQFEKDHDIEIVVLNGTLRYNMVNQLENGLNQLMIGDKRKVLFDLRSLRYFCSGGFKFLYKLTRIIRAHHGKIVFCEIPAYVKEVFTIIGVDRELTFVDTREQGILLLLS